MTEPFRIPESAKARPDDPPAELHVRGHRFIIKDFAIFSFDKGMGMLLRNGAPESNDLASFEGARVFASRGSSVVVVVGSRSAEMITKVLRETNRKE